MLIYVFLAWCLFVGLSKLTVLNLEGCPVTGACLESIAGFKLILAPFL